ncbi:MAG TPA: HDOD domain-containing protein [Burkholderiaceae bacterium]|nr:HDOD domain-containing protein [Burkholderiaceae bacterium]
MAWRVHDPRSGQDLLLVLPRQQPVDTAALNAWLDRARRAGRLSHPHLAHVVEVGEQERWPFVAYDAAFGPLLSERSRRRDGDAPADVARWIAQAAQGLAYAHDAGATHHDIQPFLIQLSEAGSVRLMGLEVAWGLEADIAGAAGERQASRAAAEQDVMALALVMHGLLAGAPALEEPDIGAALARLAPLGRELIRLPWDLPRPVPDVLRAIANRATDRQPRQRYRSARTLARALEGWLENDQEQGGKAHEQLIARVRQIGALPALPGAASRAARLALMEREHTEELAQVVLHDPAMTLELLRAVNSAQVRGSQVSGNGPVLTVRRSIAMIGLQGVRRAAHGLRDWPGPLDAEGARALERAVGKAMRAARLAQSLRPAGYDGEVVALVALMQNLGRLVAHYHFPDEMRQVLRLMQPGPGAREGEAEDPGLSELAAGFAVLGTEVEGMGIAVARWWGMDDAVLHMIRRLPLDTPVRHPDTDDDVIRTVGSAANEAVDALALPPERQQAALERVVQRYVRVLGISLRDLTAALQASASYASALGHEDDDE